MPITHNRGAKISYTAAGAGEPVVLLHSSASSANQWNGLTAVLAGRFRVIAIDLIGYGESDPWTDSAPLCLSDEVAQVEHVLSEDLGPGYDGPLHVVGHSYGGAVALSLALRRARRYDAAPLTSLTLIEPVAFHLLWNSDPEGLGSFAEIRRLADDVTLALAQGAADRAMARFIDYWSGEGCWARLGEKQQDRLLASAAKVGQDFFAAFAEPSVLADTRQIAAATLLLCGGCSPAPMRRLFEMLATSIPSSKGLILKGAGHMSPLTHANAVNSEIASHLASHARSHDVAA